ncbi:hypothetical protein GCM10009007_07830 [Formosimonas limnophila]|uniref:RloB-like protein n=2 Tax=Formosimonas limnophila TaxID=1384487 RepID=A0A8J3G0F7_9BURK|nr:hypothetical protein GCM10009007_07830 [Formosimonas limnophila]
MARTRSASSRSVVQRLFVNGATQVFYFEGPHDCDYCSKLVEQNVIAPFEQGTKLPATNIELRIGTIKRDLGNDAIERVVWIVDGGDEHINQSKKKKGKNHFFEFYKEWLAKKDNEWSKLLILINNPCLEYWFLLHRTDPPVDAKGLPRCFKSADELLNSAEFKGHCPEGKGAGLVKTIAKDSNGRPQAIKRARNLTQPLSENLSEKELFGVARAEIFQLFIST